MAILLNCSNRFFGRKFHIVYCRNKTNHTINMMEKQTIHSYEHTELNRSFANLKL